MYEYIEGKITAVQPTYIVVDAGGVGYRIQCANPYRYHVDDSTKVRVYVYQAVRDDDISLYGFVDSSEKSLFLQLINVSGIGPKSALAILANPDHQGLINAISTNDVNYLTKFPGIGKKTAGQIILDLRDKVGQLAAGQTKLNTTASAPANEDEPAELKDALAALKALGYKQRDIDRVKKQLLKQPQDSTDAYLRKALRLFS